MINIIDKFFDTKIVKTYKNWKNSGTKHFVLTVAAILPQQWSLLCNSENKSFGFLKIFANILSFFGFIADWIKIFKQPKCKPIDLGVCRSMPYNLTIFPTPFFDDELNVSVVLFLLTYRQTRSLQLEIQAEDYKIFFNTNCNQHVQFFVCSALVPMCPEQFPQALSSCRSLCEEVG